MATSRREPALVAMAVCGVAGLLGSGTFIAFGAPVPAIIVVGACLVLEIAILVVAVRRSPTTGGEQ